MRNFLKFSATVSLLGLAACGPPNVDPEAPGFDNANSSIAQECVDRSTGGRLSDAENNDRTNSSIAILEILIGIETENPDIIGNTEITNDGEEDRTIRIARQLTGIYDCMTQAANVTSYGGAYYVANALGGLTDKSAISPYFPHMGTNLQSALKRHGFY